MTTTEPLPSNSTVSSAPPAREALQGPPFAWAAAFKNVQREHGFEPLKIHGKLPDDLRGTLYRNGPGLFDRFGERYPHWFDGDGAVSAVRIAGGRAEGAIRVVETPGLRRERAAGRKLYGGYGGPMVRPLREIFLNDTKNPANTGMLAWDNRVFALCEGGKPMELRPSDLATLGEISLNGVVPQTFNPHPHRVPAHEATYSIGTRRGKEMLLDLYKIPDRGSPQRFGSVPAKDLPMAHDFAVTQRHMVIAVPPFRFRMLPLLLGRRGFVDCLEWQPDRGTDLLIVPLEDPGAAFRVTIDTCFIEHFANAWERDGELVVDCIRYPDFVTLDRYVSALGRGEARGALGNSLARFTVDLRSRRARTEILLREPNELPQVSPRSVGSPNRWIYLIGYSNERTSGSGLWDSILKLDTHTGRIERFTPGPGNHPFEPLFVPRSGAVDEDDGYLIVHVLDAAQGRSYETVLDARRIAAGPLARMEFPDALPVRLHGAFDARAPS